MENKQVGTGGMREIGEGDEEAQTSSYQKNEAQV